VSAFNNLRKTTVPRLISHVGCHQRLISYVRRFLAPRIFQLVHMEQPGQGRSENEQWNPTGLSAVSGTLAYTGRAYSQNGGGAGDPHLTDKPLRRQQEGKRTNQKGLCPSSGGHLFLRGQLQSSLSCSSNATDHRTAIAAVEALNIAAEEENLKWNATKETEITFQQPDPISRSVTLGMTIDSRLSFKDHIAVRTSKVGASMVLMSGLGHSAGGMSPKVMRSLYTSPIRTTYLPVRLRTIVASTGAGISRTSGWKAMRLDTHRIPGPKKDNGGTTAAPIKS